MKFVTVKGDLVKAVTLRSTDTGHHFIVFHSITGAIEEFSARDKEHAEKLRTAFIKDAEPLSSLNCGCLTDE